MDVSGGGAATGCAHQADATATGASIQFGHGSGASSTVLAVLVPDGVTKIDVEQSNGSRSELPVSNNVAFYQGAAISGWSFTKPGGGIDENSSTVP